MKRLICNLVILAMLASSVACTEVSAISGDKSVSEFDEKVVLSDKKDKKPPKRKEGEKEKGEIVDHNPSSNENNQRYSVEQAVSDNAQLTTIAFSGLAFLTGSEGADAFFPPGKVADFFGFQYMRDIDESGYGHNTTFLTKIAANMLYILDDEQVQLLVDLAEEQTPLYEEFGYGRLVMIDAFRKHYEEDYALNEDEVIEYSQDLYEIDGQLSIGRAEVFSNIVSTLTEEQIAYINQMDFNDSGTWPEITDEKVLRKEGLDHMTHVALMTYASEFFSWYAGSLDADVYFCPERHGTYFGGFYMKDYPAMGNDDYFISTSITGESGKAFLEVLDNDQRELIESIIVEQKEDLNRIVEVRSLVSEEFRKGINGESIDRDLIKDLMTEYGALEGEMSLLYALRFSEVGKSLTNSQMESLVKLRNQYVYPEGTYLYSREIAMPENINSKDLVE